MEFRLTDDGLECLDRDRWLRVGSWIRVSARTRDASYQRGFGALIQWRNLDGVVQQEVIFNRVLYGEQSRQIREKLVDAGYWLEPYPQSWPRLQLYLIREMAKAPTGICVERTGWHERVFVTPDWSVGSAGEPYFYAGQLGDVRPQCSGSLAQWQANIGEHCIGNPMMIFAVGVALMAPLLYPAGLESGLFHLVGHSSTGKTTLLAVAASVYAGHQFVRGWIATANGLAAVAAEQHDMLLPLDEIGMAKPEDVDVIIYHLVSGASKLRATENGSLARSTHWRTQALSSGEIYLSEIFASLGKRPLAGQQTRLIEIPTFGRYGAFDELHNLQSSQQFADHIKLQTGQYHGSLFKEWIYLLTSTDELARYVSGETQRLTDLWRTSQMSSQVVRVLRRFALVATALGLASRNYLVPWEEEESIASVRAVWQQWLAARGHVMNLEEHQVLARLKELLPKWERGLQALDQHRTVSSLGYTREVSGERQWLIDKNQFLQQLGLPSQYMREVMPLLQREWLATNEPERATVKIMIQGKFYRFFALWPDRIYAGIQELDCDE
ncbi:DUF927 domain-containing protein [Escherichia coli]|nr:DUF927 domain-containing protein [Escherichia coli]PSM37087.1 DUF927 domain-containing protein [Escherichia coli]RIJ72181.1 DUF927 domain-containing protein [Escherichia coli]RIX58253.1 DUF927 domain-containing protein [Escherichia coli]